MSNFSEAETTQILTTFFTIADGRKRSKIMGLASALSSGEEDPVLAGEIYLGALNYYGQKGKERELDEDYEDYVQGSTAEWAPEGEATG